MQTTPGLRPGHEVLAGDEAVGQLLDTFVHDHVEYLQVRRYGPGHDELFIPSMAVVRVAPKHIYLNLAAEDLVAQPWHERPGQAAAGTGSEA